MSYAPPLFSNPAAANSMSLLSGAQSLSNGSPTASTTTASWITLPPTNTDGVSFGSPVLMRAMPVSERYCRSRVGDANDTDNYKEQAGVYTLRAINTNDDLHEHQSDDECVFYRPSASTILLEEIDGWVGGAQYRVEFNATYNHSLVWRLGP